MIDRKSKIRDKVGKLLRQAEDVAGTPEEQVFLAKAFELMSKYGIEESEARVTAVQNDLPQNAVQWHVDLEGKYQPMQALLLNGIGRALHCRLVQSRHRGGTRLYVFGMQHHIDRVQMLWDILLPQMLRTVATVRPPAGGELRRYFDWASGEYLHKSVPINTTSYRRAWIAGFAKTVADRLREAETAAVEAASSGVVALYRTDAQKAQDKLRETFPRTGTVRRSSYNQSGFAHGQRDGRNARFAHSVGRGQKAISG